MHKKLCFILSFLTLTLLQPSLNQPATGGLTVSFQSENICIDYDETCGHLTIGGKTNNYMYAKIFSVKMQKNASINADNKLDYMEKFQQLTKLITTP